jgi:hypothetical protein
MSRTRRWIRRWVLGMASLCVLSAFTKASETIGPPQFLEYRCQTALDGIAFLSAQPVVKDGKGATFSLVDGPKGMTIDERTGVVCWEQPFHDGKRSRTRYNIHLVVSTTQGRDEMEWILSVVKPDFPDPQIVRSLHVDFVVPKEIADRMKEWGATGYVDATWEYMYHLFGQEPVNDRQIVCYHVASGGGAVAGNPVWAGPGFWNIDPVTGWDLGAFYHEVGHNFLGATNIADGIEHDNWARPYIHQLTCFLQAAVRCRALANPDRFGLSGQAAKTYRLFDMQIRKKFRERIVPYRQWVTSGGSAQTWVAKEKVDTYGVLAHMAILIADQWGVETLEKTLRAFRHDALPMEVYSWCDSPLKKNTLLVCVVSSAAGKDLRGFFSEWGFAVDPVFYDKLTPIVRQTVAELPDDYANGWIYCPQTGHCYRMMRSKSNWYEACRMARRAGGHLVTVNTPEEDDWLIKRFGNQGTFWIGLSRANRAYDWNWTTGEYTAYRNWQSGRPKAKSDETVVASWWFRKPGWHDCAPGQEMHVIVERESAPYPIQKE